MMKEIKYSILFKVLVLIKKFAIIIIMFNISITKRRNKFRTIFSVNFGEPETVEQKINIDLLQHGRREVMHI